MVNVKSICKTDFSLCTLEEKRMENQPLINNKKDSKALSNWSNRKKVILLILAVLLLLSVFRIIQTTLANKPEVISDVINIKVAKVLSTTLENTSPLSGRIQAVEEASILPMIPGKVASIYAELGQRVQAGDTLFKLDATQMTAGYNQANEAYINAKTNFERMQVLFTEGAVSKQQFEQTQMLYESAAQSRIMAADGLKNSTVTTPISGYVTSVNIIEGGMASQAMPSMTIANIDKVEIDTSVSEHLINKIKLLDKVQVLIQSISDKPFSGSISAVSPAPAIGSLTYPIRIIMDNPDTLIKPGMSAEIIISTEKIQNAIVVPSNAVLVKNGKTIVVTLDSNNNVSLREVTLGVDNGTQAQILQGLSVGETIVVEGQQYLDETSNINIVE
jgi:RND family efflux transporter MFP subunit